MQRKNIWIVSLLVLGAALLAAIVFWLLPAQERQQEADTRGADGCAHARLFRGARVCKPLCRRYQQHREPVLPSAAGGCALAR